MKRLSKYMAVICDICTEFGVVLFIGLRDIWYALEIC